MCRYMVDNSSHNSHKNPGKKISPFKKIFDNMKNFGVGKIW
ncbi:hypothetical protein MmTuc01_3165 [Methanosarcina mazei Tuc01]|uniref:Uncharacterized protein n=1 Tax=Methanosarcina mazei Tuc01 TaxID=1236903 RepID=M1PD10_METMZ|nr:hypothetical protein MmTuc01_3165 [Methanosarcina mazei Tuc01]